MILGGHGRDHNIGATLGLMLFAWPLGSVLGDPGVAFTGSEVDSINAVFVIIIIGFVLAFFVRTNPKDRFAGGYSICGCAIIQSKLRAEHMTRKDSEAYALPDAPTILDGRSTNFAGLPDAQALGPYRIPDNTINFGQEIRNGGFGVVCRRTFNNQPVAIKRFLPVQRSDPYSIERFVQEIQLTATLEHECLVRFVGVAWDDPSSLCMVSEYMHGGDLRTLLERDARTGYANGLDDNKLRIAVQVAHAMAYLHSLSPPVIHRDLKSRNILLTAAMDAKVIDFGVSREHQDETMTQNVGTSLWMAPEVLLSKRYDEKAGTFSFGPPHAAVHVQGASSDSQFGERLLGSGPETAAVSGRGGLPHQPAPSTRSHANGADTQGDESQCLDDRDESDDAIQPQDETRCISDLIRFVREHDDRAPRHVRSLVWNSRVNALSNIFEPQPVDKRLSIDQY